MYRDRTTRCYLGFGIQMYSDGNLAQLNARQKRFTPWIDVTMWQRASKCTPQQNLTPCKLSTSPVEHLFHTLHFLHDLVGNMESGWVWMSLDINIDQKSKLRNGKKSSHLWGIHGNTHRNDRRFFLNDFFLRLARAMRRSGCKTMLWTSS